MKIYNYSPITGEYLSEGTASENPMDKDQWLIPAHATKTAPPKNIDGFTPVFKDGVWEQVIDQRGTEYWLSDGSEHTITELGVAKPDDALDTQPSLPATVERVKGEAHRRIVAIIPEWQQRNLTAQAVVLSEKGRDNWSAEELAAWNAGEAIWHEIETIRAKSNQIEAMNPIPQDFTNDKHWTT